MARRKASIAFAAALRSMGMRDRELTRPRLGAGGPRPSPRGDATWRSSRQSAYGGGVRARHDGLAAADAPVLASPSDRSRGSANSVKIRPKRPPVPRRARRSSTMRRAARGTTIARTRRACAPSPSSSVSACWPRRSRPRERRGGPADRRSEPGDGARRVEAHPLARLVEGERGPGALHPEGAPGRDAPEPPRTRARSGETRLGARLRPREARHHSSTRAPARPSLTSISRSAPTATRSRRSACRSTRASTSAP